MGPEGALRLGGDFKVITWGGGGEEATHDRMGTFFMGGLNLSIHHVFLFCNCTRNEIREMGKKWGREKFLYFMQLFMHYIFYGENFVG